MAGEIDDHGTSHLSVIDSQRNAVSFTTTINTAFGAKLMSQSTGTHTCPPLFNASQIWMQPLHSVIIEPWESFWDVYDMVLQAIKPLASQQHQRKCTPEPLATRISGCMSTVGVMHAQA